jgi:ribosomal protein L7/L12
MNSIQNYVLESLFERKQITKEKLARALDTFSNEPAIDAFLSVLITGRSETEEPTVCITGDMAAKIRVTCLIKKFGLVGLKSAKDIVDTYIKEDTLIFPLKLVYEGPLEDLDIKNIKELFSKNGYTFDIY